jgi:Protein of unknown function DUF262/Family of unknown function (DUF6416)/Protein of unknown function (DUF1524)
MLGGTVQAQTLAPAGIFGYHIRYVVPLFQRPYVWSLEDQWQPLWEDVRTLAERLLDAPVGYGAAPVPPHFLGAIVLDQQFIPAGFIAVRHIVDGQQRLTTLQLLLDAAQYVVEQHGAPMDAQALRVLVLNDPQIAQHPDEVFKVWPTDRDQAAFRVVMDNDSTVPPTLRSSRIAQAHAFFVEQITDWVEVTGDPDKVTARLNALVRALREHLKVVVIDLEAGDNAQVIFETLNHRGSPLLAADLVKNLVFQIAQTQDANVERLYRDHWAPLDTDYWRQPVAQGRLFRPRIDVFLNYWLTMKLRREIQTDRIFSDFRDYVLKAHPPIVDLLGELAADAKVYEQMEKLPASTVEGILYYRVIKALDSAAVGPFLLWVLRWDQTALPAAQRHKALRALESWIVRRALCRATAKDVNRTVVDLLRAMDEAGPAVAGDTVEMLLANQQADSRYWPDDATLRAALREQPIYKNLTRPRLRMVLEAIEDSLRGPLGEGQPCPRNLTVEHVMPQSWQEHWGADIAGDPVAALRRDGCVQLLGNLTLVTGKLNPTMSNRPWTAQEATSRGLGGDGKRDYLLHRSQLNLNAKIVAEHQDVWTEDDIRARTDALIARVTSIWRRPVIGVQQTGLVTLTTDRVLGTTTTEETAEDAEHTGKYRLLWRWLQEQGRDEINLSFADIEQVLGMSLPQSARRHLTHWYGYEGTALGRAIRDAGWRAHQVNLTDETVTFIREETGSVGSAPPVQAAAQDARVRRGSTTERLVEYGVFEEGQQLRIVVPVGVAEDRAPIATWLEEDPARSAVTWRGDPQQPVVWAADGQPYNLTTLIRHIIEEATGQPPRTQVWGLNWYRDDHDQTLAKLAERLEGQAPSSAAAERRTNQALDDDHPLWDRHAGGSGHDGPEWTLADLAKAEAFYASLQGKAKAFMDLVMDRPGQVLDVDEIVEILPDVFDGSRSVAGALSGLHLPREASGRRYPFCWWEGNPSRYAMKPSVAEVFRQARRKLGL